MKLSTIFSVFRKGLSRETHYKLRLDIFILFLNLFKSAVTATTGNSIDDCTLDHSVLSGGTRIFSSFNRNKDVPRPGAVGDDSAKIKFTIYGDVATDYTGFVLFFRQDCGADFLRGKSAFIRF